MSPKPLPELTSTQRQIALNLLPDLANLIKRNASKKEIRNWKKTTVNKVVQQLFPPADDKDEDAPILEESTIMGAKSMISKSRVETVSAAIFNRSPYSPRRRC